MSRPIGVIDGVEYVEPNKMREMIGIRLYEHRNQTDTVFLSFLPLKDAAKASIWRDIPGAISSADFDKYCKDWMITICESKMRRLVSRKDLTVGEGMVVTSGTNHRFNICMIYMGFDKTNKSYTIMLRTERNKDYVPPNDSPAALDALAALVHGDVSGDPV